MRNIALIVAGGRGSRLGADTPKQYLHLNGKPIIRHAVEAFIHHPDIHDVQCVIHPDDEKLFKQSVEGLDVLPFVYGGETRQQSSFNGLKALKNADRVLIHDAARPFVSKDLIDDVLNALETSEAVIPGVLVSDTIKRVEGIQVAETLDRSALVAVQTPQGFDFNTIFAAHEKMEGQSCTDDASVAEAAGISISVVDGEVKNRKITTMEDLQNTSGADIRTGTGFDVHAFSKKLDKPLMMGGIEIPHSRTLSGHSDADVVLHALVDALLGAVGKGDIGDYFPPSDPQWKGADSSIFIEKTVELLDQLNAHITNVDVTIMCEAPKIGPHKAKMKTRISELLHVTEDRVNVKATTTEKLGFTGREEGIACQASATVRVG